METEITIFEIKEKDVSVNKSQRELDYENLQKNSKITAQHFTSFYELELFNEQRNPPKTNIASVLCKYVIQYCTPVISSAPGFHISLQNESPTHVYSNESNTFHVVPTNEQFHIIGIKLPTIFIKYYDKRTFIHQDYVSLVDLANTGHYGFINWYTGKYLLQRRELSHIGQPKIEDLIIFKDNAHAVETLSYIIDYIDFIELYFQQNIYTLHVEFKASPYTPSFNNTLPSNIPPIEPRKDLILDSLEDLGIFRGRYDINNQLILDQTGLLYAYNLAKLVGIDDELFKKEHNDKRKGIEYNTEFRKQINEGFAKKLEIAKKQTISFNKYKIHELNNLDRKQREVVELEYRKLEKFLSKDVTPKAKLLQKAFYNLRNSFTDITSDRLAAAIAEIRQEVSSTELNKLELLEGGLCPHIFFYGEEMLKNFGKPWMNTELRTHLISRFSLPKDINGYFCKICGEQLAEADNEDIVRFIGGERVFDNRQDDPLQTMIWKEAMYIITTYIKFNTPIPLKPLVNSLASGLRDVISEEESKLFKSKTNTTDSIRDTLTIYSSVYIYAALCALMMANPNKIIFGRDKPVRDIDKKDLDPSKHENAENSLNQLKEASELVNTKKSEPSKKEIEDLNSLRSSPVVGNREFEDQKLNKFMNQTDNLFGNVDILSPNDQPDQLLFGRLSDLNIKDRPDGQPSSRSDGHLSDRRQSRKKSNKNGSVKHRRDLRVIARDQYHAKYKYVNGGKVIENSKLYERYLLTTALNLILLTKDSTIKKLKNMSVDLIKQIFLKNAYTWAKLHVKPIKIEQEISHVPRVQTIITTDPFYQYLYYAKRLAYNSGVEKHYPHSIDDVSTMLGRTAEKIDSDLKVGELDIYDTVQIPQAWRFGEKSKKYDLYTYRSFLEMYDYVKNRIYQKEFVPRNPFVAEYYNQYKDLIELEKVIRYEYAKTRVFPLFQLEWLNDIRSKYNDFAPENLDLAQHYCPDGNRHIPGSFIYISKITKGGRSRKYSRTGGADIEYTTKEITEMLAKKDREQLAKFSTLKLIDERCKRCGNLIRSAKSSEKSDKSLNSMFKKIDDVLALYQYFETRCPEGDLHDIKNNICSKCGLKTDIQQRTADDYYNKYLSTFKKVEREKQSISISSLKQVQATKEVTKIQEATYTAENDINTNYKFGLQKTAEWSQISDIKYNILSNLGLSEKIEYNDIEKAVVNPVKQLDDLLNPIVRGTYQTQALKIKGYILQILREYNMLMNYQNIVDIPLELKEILDIQKKVEIVNLQTSMPQFGSEFIDLDNKYKFTLASHNYANFLMEYLASIIIRIYNDSHEKYKPMAKMLVKYFTANIIMQEKLFSKASPLIFRRVNEVMQNETESEDDTASEDGHKTESSDSDFDENAVETYENEINFEAMDVENPDDVWEND